MCKDDVNKAREDMICIGDAYRNFHPSMNECAALALSRTDGLKYLSFVQHALLDLKYMMSS